jgi:hypothetical protein
MCCNDARIFLLRAVSIKWVRSYNWLTEAQSTSNCGVCQVSVLCYKMILKEKRLTLALGIFKLRRITWPFLWKVLEYKLIMCYLPPCRREKIDWSTVYKQLWCMSSICLMLQNDFKRLSHSVMCSIDYWLLHVNRKFKTLALGIFKLRRITWPFLWKVLEYKIIMCYLPPCRRDQMPITLPLAYHLNMS